MEYEINFLVLQSNTEALDKIREKVKKIIAAHGGSVVDQLEYKKRKLAYKISHEFYGFYTVFRFTIENSAEIETVKKELNLVSDVARYIIVRTDELPPLQKEIVPPKQEQEQPIKEKKVIKQEDVEKLLAEKKPDSAQQEKIDEEEEKREIEKEKPEQKSEGETKDKKESKQGAGDKKGQDSLEDLDKKLDEILNI